MLKLKKIAASCVALFLTAVLSSCGHLGYSLVLWNNPEAQVHEGQIVKVYVKSNISHSYIIMALDSKHKVEIPLWQISEPQSRKKTEKLASSYAEFEHTYASVKLDGLPIRSEAVNTSKQVYRLRKDEIIRVLYKGKGQAVTNGKGNLSGEWLRVLTETGTLGWCFSYNLNLFERTDDILALKSEAKTEEIDEDLITAVEKKWYPEEFADMIKTGRYDLARMNADFGFDFGQVDWVPEETETVEAETDLAQIVQKEVKLISVLKTSKNGEEIQFTARLRTFDIDKSWTYTKTSKNQDGAYKLGANGVYVTLRGKNTIAVQYMDSDGKLKNENFVAISDSIQEKINDEIERRNAIINSFVTEGPSYSSSNYGTITFNEDNTATWKNFKLLVPGIVSASAKGNIKVYAELYMANQFKNEFDGIITFNFEGMDSPVNFFYKKDSGGLRLEDASGAVIKGNLVTARGSSPMVMYFKNNW